MELPKRILSFVLAEYMYSRGFLATAISDDTLVYMKENTKISFNRKEYDLDIENAIAIIEASGGTIGDFKIFCEYIYKPGNFEAAMERSVIKTSKNK